MTTLVLTLAILPATLISARLFSRAIGSLSPKELTPYSYAFWFGFMLQGVLGAYFILWGARSHPGLRFVRSESSFQLTCVIVLTALVITPVGMLVVQRAFPRAAMNARNFLRAPIVDVGNDNRGVLVIIAFVTGILYLTAYSVFRESPLRLSLVFGEESAALARARFEFTFAESVLSRIVRNIIGVSFSAAIGYVTFAYALWTRRRSWWLLFIVQLAPVIVFQAASLAKARVPQFIIGLVFVFVLVRGRVPARILAGAFALVVVALLGSYAAVALDPDETGAGILAGDNLIGRIVVGQILGVPNYLEIFPYEHPFLWGSELQALSLFGTRPTTAARIAMEYLHPDGVRSRTVGVQNTFFGGHAYANFGWLGVVLAPLWVGGVMKGVELIATSFRKTPFVIGGAVWVMYQLSKAVGSGLMSEFVVNTNILGTVALLWLTRVVAGALSSN